MDNNTQLSHSALELKRRILTYILMSFVRGLSSTLDGPQSRPEGVYVLVLFVEILTGVCVASCMLITPSPDRRLRLWTIEIRTNIKPAMLLKRCLPKAFIYCVFIWLSAPLFNYINTRNFSLRVYSSHSHS